MIEPATHRVRDATRADAGVLARLRRASLAELGLLARGDEVAFERAAHAEFAARLAEDVLAAKLRVCEDEVAGSGVGGGIGRRSGRLDAGQEREQEQACCGCEQLDHS